MRIRCTWWHTLVLVALTGCSSSHSSEDAGTNPCPEVIGTCMDECCLSSGRPTFDAECNATCPAGTSLIDRCAPAMHCCDEADAGAGTIECRAGACCTDVAAPIVNIFDCSTSCPAGYSTTCEPDPGVRCAAPWLTCDAPSDCQLAPADSCCFPCVSLELADVIGINMSGATEYYESVCPGGVACPPCVPGENPALRPTCDADSGFCEVLDVRALELSACANDTECVLRVTDCCPCGADTSPERLIAVRADAELTYAEIACDPGTGCDDCLPAYPTTVEAFCAADGHCDVRPAP